MFELNSRGLLFDEINAILEFHRSQESQEPRPAERDQSDRISPRDDSHDLEDILV